MDRFCNKRIIQLEGRERNLPECLKICPDHELSQLIDISLEDCGKGLVFKCGKCTKSNNYVEIKEIAFRDDNDIYDNYPILPEDLSQKIRKILEQTEPKQNMVDQIRSYFKNLRVQILQSISNMEEEMIIKAQEVDSFQKNLIDEYNKQSRKIELRDIIFNDSNLTQKSEEIKTIVQEVVRQSNEFEQNLQDMIERFNLINESIQQKSLIEDSYEIINSCLEQIKKKEMYNIDQIHQSKILFIFILKAQEKIKQMRSKY